MLKKYSVRHVSSEAGKLLRYLGPGILITVGFIDPGNWAANIAAGSGFGYSLLWMVTLSTIMLVFLQHNVAHLGIVTGLCLAEATTYLPPFLSRLLLITAVVASIATALAEILGGALAISMLTGMPVIPAAVREQDICDKEIKNKKELCYNASDQTNKITGDPSYETYYNRRTETS